MSPIKTPAGEAAKIIAARQAQKTAPEKGEFHLPIFILGYHLRNHRKDITLTGQTIIRLAIDALEECQNVQLYHPIGKRDPSQDILPSPDRNRLARKIERARELKFK